MSEEQTTGTNGTDDTVGTAPGAKPTSKELLANARRCWKRLNRTEAGATLDRIDYALALVAVRESRAYLDEGCDNFFAWVLKETGRKRSQANAYLDAARVPRELAKDQVFDWRALALLGRAGDWPKAQCLLAEGISRLGFGPAQKAWTALRDTPSLAASTDERLEAALRKALDGTEAKTTRGKTAQRHAALRRGMHAVAGVVTRLSTGEPVADDERRIISGLRRLIETAPQEELPGSAGRPDPGRAAIAVDSQKSNNSKDKGSTFRPPERPLETSGAQAQAQTGQARSPGAAERPQPDRWDDAELEDYNSFELEYDGPIDDREPPLPYEVIIERLVGPAGKDRADLVDAVFRLLCNDSPADVEDARDVLTDLTNEASGEEPPLGPDGPLDEYYLKAIEVDISDRWPWLFGLLLALDDRELPSQLFQLAESPRVPGRLRARAEAAGADRGFWRGLYRPDLSR